MADLLYAGDRILIGGLLTVAIIGGCAAAVIAAAIYGIWRAVHANRPTIPAADDNEAGHDADALWTCRRIDNATTQAGYDRLRDEIRKARKEKP